MGRKQLNSKGALFFVKSGYMTRVLAMLLVLCLCVRSVLLPSDVSAAEVVEGSVPGWQGVTADKGQSVKERKLPESNTDAYSFGVTFDDQSCQGSVCIGLLGTPWRLAGALGDKNKAPDGDLIISVRGLCVV